MAMAAAIYGLAFAVALCGVYLLVTGWPHIGP